MPLPRHRNGGHGPINASPDVRGLARGRADRIRRTGLWTGCFVLWILIIGDPLRWPAAYGATFLLLIPIPVLFILLGYAVLTHKTRVVPPLLAFSLYAFAQTPFSYNIGHAIPVARVLMGYCGLAILTMTVVQKARDAVPIVAWALLYHFTWWTLVGAIPGRVVWHTPAYNNYDSFGPMMAIGIGTSFFMAIGGKDRRVRFIGFATAAGCIIGLVSSFARGAVVAGVATLGWIWLRSPNKLRTAGLGLVGAVVVLVATEVLFTNVDREDAKPNFWEEMATISDTGGTRTDRYQLWAIARIEFAQNPVFGVGPGSFGAYAAEQLSGGQLQGVRDDPQRLYNKALHNMYYQLLSEFGGIGVAIFIWMMWDFWQRNRALRRRERIDTWIRETGEPFDLRSLSLALEAGMVGFLAGGYFYNQIFDVHWFYTLITINALLFQVTRPVVASNHQRRPLSRVGRVTGGRPRVAW